MLDGKVGARRERLEGRVLNFEKDCGNPDPRKIDKASSSRQNIHHGQNMGRIAWTRTKMMMTMMMAGYDSHLQQRSIARGDIREWRRHERQRVRIDIDATGKSGEAHMMNGEQVQSTLYILLSR